MHKDPNRIGLLQNEEYFQQLCFSIIDDLENNNFHWEGNEHGVHLTINGQSQFIPNEADEEKEIKKLWKQAKKKSSKKK
jgi:hypothetical protein